MDTYGYSAEFLARVCGVDISTARRWKRRGSMPGRYRHLIELADGADLGALSVAWRGWRLCGDELVNPEGQRFLVDQVRALELKSQLIGELEHRLARARKPAPVARELVFRVRLEDGADAPTVAVESHA